MSHGQRRAQSIARRARQSIAPPALGSDHVATIGDRGIKKQCPQARLPGLAGHVFCFLKLRPVLSFCAHVTEHYLNMCSGA